MLIISFSVLVFASLDKLPEVLNSIYEIFFRSKILEIMINFYTLREQS
jgi:hypothetical protein